MAEEIGTDIDDNDHKFESFQPIEELDIHAPIVGYEVVEARKRFTVYQIFVQLGGERSWHVFRRYSDFIRLDEGLRKLFNDFHGILPPKKYFGDNFDPAFIEMRKQGLQEYIDNVIIRQEVISAQPAVEFFCFDDPPGPHDSLEESRAFIETLEDSERDEDQTSGTSVGDQAGKVPAPPVSSTEASAVNCVAVRARVEWKTIARRRRFSTYVRVCETARGGTA